MKKRTKKAPTLADAIVEAREIRDTAMKQATLTLEEQLAPHLRNLFERKVEEAEEVDESRDIDENDVDESNDIDENDVDESQDIDESEDVDENQDIDEAEDIDEDIDIDALLQELAEEDEVREMDDDDEIDVDDVEQHADQEFDADVDDTEFSDDDSIDGDEDIADLSMDELEDIIRDIVAQEVGVEDDEMDLDAGEGEEDFSDGGEMDYSDDEDEEVDIAEMIKEDQEVDESALDEADVSLIPMIAGTLATIGLAGITTLVHYMQKSSNPRYKKIGDALGNLGSGASAGREKSGSAGGQGTGQYNNPGDGLSERRMIKKAAIELTKVNKELKEVNLLNSKLLFLNKIIAKTNLPESKYLEIVKLFDSAATPKEAKVIFESVSKVVGKNTTKNYNKRSLKENMGFASSPQGMVSSKNSNNPIIDDTVTRWQELANIPIEKRK
jgi:hypothetical protein